jgi:hypothetical protein
MLPALGASVVDLARSYRFATSFLYLGRGFNFPVALEGALKLKEISYIHAEGYAAAEMKHGPIALIDEMMPVVCIAPHDAVFDKITSNIQEVKARKGKIIAITTRDEPALAGKLDYEFRIPETVDLLAPILASVPLQLLAYYIAAINIEATYHDLAGEDYEAFPGICLTDTFQMYEKDDLVSALTVDNSARRKRQKKLDIRVIVGNPPYSIGQGSQNDNNQNIAYPSLDKRIAETYANQSSATNSKGLYDSYIRAIRWASDRVGASGVVGPR